MTEVGKKREGEGSEPMGHPGEEAAPALPTYEPPTVITYHREELQEELGPALACSFSGSVVGC